MPIDRLTALDQLMLVTSEIWPQDIGALAILDGTKLLKPNGQFRIEPVREAIQSRLHLAPRFRQLIYAPRRGLGGPLWVDAPYFDLSEHVSELPLAAPAGEAEILGTTERLRKQRLDPSRPPWRMWFMIGLSERRIGLFVKMHHAMADGMAAMTTIRGFLDPVPDSPVAPAHPWAPAPTPSARELLADNLRQYVEGFTGVVSKLARPRATVRELLATWPATRELLAEEPGPQTSLDRLVGPDRNLALIRSAIQEIKEIGRAYDATVNDVLLAATAGGLRALLRSRGEPVQDVTLPVYVPVSLRRRLRGTVQGNEIAQMVIRLPLGESDPIQRLQQIATQTATRKARRRPSLGIFFRSRILRRLILKAALRQRVNVTTASIPGPKVPLYLAGARVLEVFPVLPLVANEALGVGAISYAGMFNVGIAADRDAYRDIDVLSAGIRDELNALGRSVTDTDQIADAASR